MNDIPSGTAVLVVDDNPSDLSLVTAFLEDCGLRTMTADDGESALEQARRADTALILLDIRMPGNDGLGICRRLKADEGLRDIPVIIMTGLDAQQTRIAGFEAGAVDYVIKPVGQHELQARVKIHLRLQEQCRSLHLLERANQSLQGATDEFRHAEDALRTFNAELEQPVAHRSSDVEAANRHTRAEQERQAHIRLLESLDRVNRAIQRTDDAEQMLWEVVRITLSVFDCDRAWLLFPCDPEAPTYRVPIEVTRPGLPGACELDLDVPMKPGADEICRALLSCEGPVSFGAGSDRPLYKEVTEQFGVQSQMIVGIYPKTGRPWMFGMHQCSHPRLWTQEERRLFNEIARRIGDGLSSALILRELRQSEARFRALVEQAADAFFLLDNEGRILDANQSACDSLGYSRAELLAMNIADVSTEVVEERQWERFWDGLQPGRHTTIEGRHQRKDGNCFPVEVHLGVLELDEEKLVLGLARDISDRKQAEEQRLSHLRFLEHLDRINDSILTPSEPDEMLDRVLDTVLEVFQCDRAWLLYPCDPDAPTWRVQVERTRPEYPGALELNEEFTMHPDLADYFGELLTTGEPSTGELNPGEPDWDPNDTYGVRSHIDMAIRPKVGRAWQFGLHQCSYARTWTKDEQRLFKEIGRRIADGLTTLLLFRDLQDSEETHRTLLANIPQKVFYKSRDSVYISCNDSYAQDLGITAAEIAGRTDHEFFPRSLADKYREDDQRIMERGEAETLEERYSVGRNEYIVQTVKTPVRDEQGKITGVLGIFWDITESKQAEDALHNAQQELVDRQRREKELVQEELSRARDELIEKGRLAALGQLTASVAHELRNPLGTIRSSMFVIARALGDQDLGVAADLERARRNVIRCDTIIEELLDYVRNTPLSFEPVLVDPIVDRILNEHPIPQGIEVARQFTSESRAALDSERFRRCLINIITNACQAMTGEEGARGRLTVETLEINDRVEIRISDTGPGIPEEDLERVLEPLYSTKSFGVGLGLPISKQTLEQHGGDIAIHSRRGTGTRVSLWLPCYEEATGS